MQIFTRPLEALVPIGRIAADQKWTCHINEGQQSVSEYVSVIYGHGCVVTVCITK